MRVVASGCLAVRDTSHMALSVDTLVDEFGRAAEIGNAVIFVGAGLSRAVRLPDWAELLAAPARTANVPMGNDLPLVAEYIVQTGDVSRDQLESAIREQILAVGAVPGPAHIDLARLPVDQIWTTNYDQLIEIACGSAVVIENEDDGAQIGAARRCVIKMHGSLSETGWARTPVITRRDYEEYQQEHRRMWALLKAAYLSRTMLFVGFSFTDPNIEILLRLARTLGTAVGDRHMTVMRRPAATDNDELRAHNLRVSDLEDSGVRVHEVGDYVELDLLFSALVRRTRPQRLFVSGSFERGNPTAIGRQACAALADQVAQRGDWTFVSMAGPAGWHLSQQVGEHRRAEKSYRASDFEFNFRSSTAPAEAAEERLGTFVYHALEREELVPELLSECRAMVLIGGRANTKDEIAWARAAGVGIVPFASAGGAAAEYWRDVEDAPPDLGGRPVDPAVWERLNDPNLGVAARAASRLLDQAMYFRD